MASITETGATDIKRQKNHRKVEGSVYYEMDADIRMGLLLLSEHVYSVDGKKTGFSDIPGFRMLRQDEIMSLLGIESRDVKEIKDSVDEKAMESMRNNAHNVTRKIMTKGIAGNFFGDSINASFDAGVALGVAAQDAYAWSKEKDTASYMPFFPKNVKSKGDDKVKDVEYRMPKDLYKEFDVVHGVSSKNTDVNERTNKRGEKVIFCGGKNIQQKNGSESVSVVGGILSNDGFVCDCGFKAAIYEHTDREYKFHNVKNLQPPFDGNSLLNVKYVLAFSGTDFSSGIADWIKTNLGQALPYSFMYPMQYKLAVNMGLLVARSIRMGITKRDEWVITGHSLGGGLSSAASVVSGVNAVTFNAAGLNREALAAYIYDLHQNANAGFWSKSYTVLRSTISLAVRTKSNKKYLSIVNDSNSKNKVCVYRGTTDILTSTQDNIHGSKTNACEYLGLDEKIDELQNQKESGGALQTQVNKTIDSAKQLANSTTSYARNVINLPSELSNNLYTLKSDLTTLPSKMASSASQMLSDTKDLFSEIGNLFTGSNSLSTKFGNIADKAKQVASDAKEIYEAPKAIFDDLKNIKDNVYEVWQKPVELYLEAIDLWENIKKTIDEINKLANNPLKALLPANDNSNENKNKKENFLKRLIANAPKEGLLGDAKKTVDDFHRFGQAVDSISKLDPKQMLSQGITVFEDVGDLFSDVSHTMNNLKNAIKNPKQIIGDIKGTINDIKKTTKDVKQIYNTVHNAYKDLKSSYDAAVAMYGDMKNICNDVKTIFSDPQAKFALAKNALNSAMKTLPVWDSLIPKPIAASLSVMARASGEFPPRTYGKRIDVNTEKYIEYSNPDNDKYLAYTDDKTGHGLWILLDGFVYNIYDTNNHFITCQQGDKATDSDVFEKVIKKHWRWQNEDETTIRLYHKRDIAPIGGKDEQVSVYPNIIEVDKYTKPDKNVSEINGNKREKDDLQGRFDIVGCQVFIGTDVDKEKYQAEYVPKKNYSSKTAEEYLNKLIATTGVEQKQKEKMKELYRKQQK